MCRVDPFPAYPHQVLAVVLSVRADSLNVLLGGARRRRTPGVGPSPAAESGPTSGWARPSPPTWQRRSTSATSPGSEAATHSKVDRDPRARVLATGYLALVPTAVQPELPADTVWHPVADLPRLAFDHPDFIHSAVDRLRAKLSYTNIGFALAPPEFTINQLRQIVSAALGYDVGATNLQRVMTRRQMIEPTGNQSTPGPGGGRPAARYRFHPTPSTSPTPSPSSAPQHPEDRTNEANCGQAWRIRRDDLPALSPLHPAGRHYRKQVRGCRNWSSQAAADAPCRGTFSRQRLRSWCGHQQKRPFQPSG